MNDPESYLVIAVPDTASLVEVPIERCFVVSMVMMVPGVVSEWFIAYLNEKKVAAEKDGFRITYDQEKWWLERYSDQQLVLGAKIDEYRRYRLAQGKLPYADAIEWYTGEL